MSLSTPSRDAAADLPPTYPQRLRELARDSRPALRLLRESAWIRALLGVVLLSILFVLLGRWQFGRHLHRSAANHQITSNYAAVPVPLETAIPAVRADPHARVPLAVQWRSVQLTGSYQPAHTVLIRNRPYSSGGDDSSNGYEVVVPLQLSGGEVVLIDRGWIPASDTSAARPDVVPAAPPGTVTVVARLRPSEPRTDRPTPAGQALRINARQLAAGLPDELNQRVLNGFAVLVSEKPSAANTPARLDPPDPGLGINLAYAVQWWLFAVAAYAVLAWAGIKEVRRRRSSSYRAYNP